MHGPIDNKAFKKLLLSMPEHAIQYLYRYYFSRLVRISSGRTHDIKTSQEIVQDAFIFVYNNRHELVANNNLDFNSYLFGIVTHKSIDAYNKFVRTHEQMYQYFHNLQTAIVHTEGDISLAAEKAIVIWKLIASFPTKERECLVLKFIDNMKVNEIARHLNISQKAVERSITSAYKRFRKLGAFIYSK